jgi:hypothetical protein
MGLLSTVLAGVVLGCFAAAAVGVVWPAAFPNPAKGYFPSRKEVLGGFGLLAAIAAAGSWGTSGHRPANPAPERVSATNQQAANTRPRPKLDDVTRVAAGCRDATNSLLVKLRAGEIDRIAAGKEAQHADEVCIGKYPDMDALIVNDDRAYQGCHGLLATYQTVDRAVVTATREMTPESLARLSHWVNEINDAEMTCSGALAD